MVNDRPTSRPEEASFRAKLRYLPPNAATLASLALGLVSIRFAIQGEFEEAAWFILYSVLFDQLDGTLARLLKAQSRMGMELDSFSDFVSFGLAPAFLVLAAPDRAGFLHPVGPPDLLAAVYVFCCCLRLARFNALDSTVRPDFFHGIPSTLGGALVGSLTVVAYRHEFRIAERPLLLAACLAALGVLMLSPVSPPKIPTVLRKGLSSGTVWKALTIANLVVVYVFVVGRWLPEYLLALTLAYFISGFVFGVRELAAARRLLMEADAR